jgi:hypothetical protein
VYIIEPGSRRFLVGVGDGPMALIAELEKDAEVQPEVSAPHDVRLFGFRKILERAMSRPAAPAKSGSDESIASADLPGDFRTS